MSSTDGYSFDNTDANDDLEAAADEEMRGLSTPDVEEEPDEDYSKEIDKRLEVASYYQELRRGSLFTSNTEAARIVEREVRRFVQQRLEILVGMRAPEPVQAPAAKLPFSDQQVTALLIWADRLLKKGDLPQVEPAKPEPTIRQATVPAPIAVAPKVLREAPAVVAKPAPPAAPPPVKKPAKPKVEAPAEPPLSMGKKLPSGKGPRRKTRMELDDSSPTGVREVEIDAEVVRPAEMAPPMSNAEIAVLLQSTTNEGIVIRNDGVTGDLDMNSLMAEAMRLPTRPDYIPPGSED